MTIACRAAGLAFWDEFQRLKVELAASGLYDHGSVILHELSAVLNPEFLRVR